MIKEALNQKADEIEVKDRLFNQIKTSIYEEEQKTVKNKGFSFKNKKKLLTVVASCVALISITVIGGTLGKGWIGHSMLRYKTFPDKTVVSQDIGFTPKYVEALPGGFEFYMGHTGEAALVDDTDRPIVETKSLTLGYKQKETGKKVSLSSEQYPENYMMLDEGTTLVETYKGSPLYYYEKMYKFVPVDYELTEEDNRAYANGEIEISVGSDKVTVEKVQSINWSEGDIRYSIGGNDTGLSVEDLMEMAKTVIDAQ